MFLYYVSFDSLRVREFELGCLFQLSTCQFSVWDTASWGSHVPCFEKSPWWRLHDHGPNRSVGLDTCSCTCDRLKDPRNRNNTYHSGPVYLVRFTFWTIGFPRISIKQPRKADNNKAVNKLLLGWVPWISMRVPRKWALGPINFFAALPIDVMLVKMSYFLLGTKG